MFAGVVASKIYYLKYRRVTIGIIPQPTYHAIYGGRDFVAGRLTLPFFVVATTSYFPNGATHRAQQATRSFPRATIHDVLDGG